MNASSLLLSARGDFCGPTGCLADLLWPLVEASEHALRDWQYHGLKALRRNRA